MNGSTGTFFRGGATPADPAGRVVGDALAAFCAFFAASAASRSGTLSFLAG